MPFGEPDRNYRPACSVWNIEALTLVSPDTVSRYCHSLPSERAGLFSAQSRMQSD